MRKQKPYIFAYLVSFLVLTGCGIKGPLYQTPVEPVEQGAETQKNTAENQQEK